MARKLAFDKSPFITGIGLALFGLVMIFSAPVPVDGELRRPVPLPGPSGGGVRHRPLGWAWRCTWTTGALKRPVVYGPAGQRLS
jgi:hypothetical protein